MRWLFGAHSLALALLSIGISLIESYRDQKRFAWLLIPALACTIAAHIVIGQKMPGYNTILALSPDALILIGCVVMVLNRKVLNPENH